MSEQVERMAAGVVQASFTGPVVPAWLARRIDDGLGSVCLFGSNLCGVEVERGGTAVSGVEAAAHVARALHALRPSLVVATDEEGGDVTRLEADRGSSEPGNAALGAAGDLVLTREVAGSLGRLLRLVGIDLDLAPCADINTYGNPAIGVRSFGTDPQLVASHVGAAVMGLQDEGVAACAKHFPGHGATGVDSHLYLPVVDAPADVLRVRELAPFRAALAAGVTAVMIGHLRVPALDEDLPATISPAIITDLLRGELGFEGVVVTDALDMEGIGGAKDIPMNVVRAVAAGADLCCLGPDAADELVGACIDALLGALRSGALTEERLSEAAGRVGSLRARTAEIDAGGVPPSPYDRSDGPTECGVAGVSLLAEAVAELADSGAVAAERALHVEGRLPASANRAHVVELGRPPMIAAGRVPWGVAEPLAALDASISSERLSHPDDVASVFERAADRPLVVVTRDPQHHVDRLELLEALCVARPDAVVVDMGWPSDVVPSPEAGAGCAAARVRTFGASRVTGAAVARLLAGDTKPTGRQRVER